MKPIKCIFGIHEFKMTTRKGNKKYYKCDLCGKRLTIE
jgi:hypothetical protein